MSAVDDALRAAAQRYGLSYDLLRQIAQIESGLNPRNRREGSQYAGLFQLSDGEFRRMGGGDNILDPHQNAMAGAALLRSHIESFNRQYGRPPSATELYMIHQQGWGGFQAHMANPDRPAWENMLGTREGQARGAEWAQQAIAGNIPSRYLQGRDPRTITSAEFMRIWQDRMSRGFQAGTGVEPPPAPPSPQAHPDTPELNIGGGPPGGPQGLGPRQPSTRVAPESDSQDQPPGPGFFDRQYPLAYSITGQDRPILSSLFGEPGMGDNRTNTNLGRAFATIGSGLARATTPVAGLGLSSSAPTPVLPEQDDRAFALQPLPRRRPYA